jgi:hypothetical protein
VGANPTPPYRLALMCPLAEFLDPLVIGR